MILKINKVEVVDEPKVYEVKNKVLHINGEPMEISYTKTQHSLDVTDLEDFESIERNEEGEMVVSLNFFISDRTKLDFFSVVNKEDARFPYQVKDGKKVWENDIEMFEGLSW